VLYVQMSTDLTPIWIISGQLGDDVVVDDRGAGGLLLRRFGRRLQQLGLNT
jgi:hypothetical protein